MLENAAGSELRVQTAALSRVLILQLVSSKGRIRQPFSAVCLSVCLFGRLIIPWVSRGLIAIEYGYDFFVCVYLHPSPFVTIENGYFYQHFLEHKKVKV